MGKTRLEKRHDVIFLARLFHRHDCLISAGRRRAVFGACPKGLETRRADASGRGRPHRQCGDLDHAVARLNCAFLMLTRQFRSEEHTSELQSLMRISYAVFCLKKKIKPTTTD